MSSHGTPKWFETIQSRGCGRSLGKGTSKGGAVGAGGGLITHEVVEAECRDGWDAYCKMDCSGSVGSTYNTLDPAVLVGG